MIKFPRTVFVAASSIALALTLASAAENEKPAPAAEQKSEHKEQGQQGRRDPQQMVNRLDQSVGLTAEQKAKVLELYTKLADVPREERRAKMADTEKQVRALLTPEQQKKFDEALSHRRGRNTNSGGVEGPKKEQ